MGGISSRYGGMIVWRIEYCENRVGVKSKVRSTSKEV